MYWSEVAIKLCKLFLFTCVCFPSGDWELIFYLIVSSTLIPINIGLDRRHINIDVYEDSLEKNKQMHMPKQRRKINQLRSQRKADQRLCFGNSSSF